jgi:NADPH:quinone reductase-like Zn-dependent oxidoreductase
MRAITYDTYGSPEVLRLEEAERPEVGDDEVLIHVRAASVNPIDWHFLTGKPFLARLLAGGLLRPGKRVLGSDLSGQIEAVGARIEHLHPGDEVFGLSYRFAAFAEYLCAPAAQLRLAKKPANLSFEEAAAVPAAAFGALHGLRTLGQLQPGQKVLVNGASGGIGTFAVQIAKAHDAVVTGVCSKAKMNLVGDQGADHVIDYTQDDFATGDARYDLIFDVAAKRSFSDCKRVLTDGGTYLTTAFSPLLALKQLLSKLGSRRFVTMAPTKITEDDLQTLVGLVENGKVRPVIGKRYSLSETPEALRVMGQGPCVSG